MKKRLFFPLITYTAEWMERNSNVLLPVCNNAFTDNSSLGFDGFNIPPFQFLHRSRAITLINITLMSSVTAVSQALGLSDGSGIAGKPKLC